jgi:maltooligosyltrehalose trehalohydrolase
VAERAPGKLLVAEDERNDPSCVQDWRLDGIWADDFHHQVRVSLTGERDGYYAAYQGGAADLAETIRGGWFYQGQRYPVTGHPRGRPAPDLPAEAFLYCIQNHDQVGNRATGRRLSHDVDPQSYRAVSTLLLFLPMTPILFMGQEWAASTPFQFFTDHDPELGKLVSEGRRREFAGFQAFQDPATRAQIPDPQDEQTFLRSRLRWDEREQGEHRRTLDLYRALLRLRREDPVLRSAGRRSLEASARGSLLTVRARHGGEERVLQLNLGDQPVALEGNGQVIFRSDGGSGPTLPPRTAAISAAKI